MQGIFAAQAAASDTPCQTIARVNLALYKRGIESRFVTLMYGTLEPDGRLTYCNAGHNPPLVVGTGAACAGSRSAARSSGCSRRAMFEEETVALAPGDWLIVFSDGVSEALSADGEEYGEARILQPSSETAGSVAAAATARRRSSPTSARSRKARRRATTSRRWSCATACPPDGGSREDRVDRERSARGSSSAAAERNAMTHRAAALILWFALAFVVWNGVYDMRMHDTVRGYLLQTPSRRRASAAASTCARTCTAASSTPSRSRPPGPRRRFSRARAPMADY